MAIYWPTPGFKGRTFKLCVLTRGDFNFCVRSSPLRGTGKEEECSRKVGDREEKSCDPNSVVLWTWEAPGWGIYHCRNLGLVSGCNGHMYCVTVGHCPGTHWNVNVTSIQEKKKPYLRLEQPFVLCRASLRDVFLVSARTYYWHLFSM